MIECILERRIYMLTAGWGIYGGSGVTEWSHRSCSSTEFIFWDGTSEKSSWTGEIVRKCLFESWVSGLKNEALELLHTVFEIINDVDLRFICDMEEMFGGEINETLLNVNSMCVSGFRLWSGTWRRWRLWEFLRRCGPRSIWCCEGTERKTSRFYKCWFR